MRRLLKNIFYVGCTLFPFFSWGQGGCNRHEGIFTEKKSMALLESHPEKGHTNPTVPISNALLSPKIRD